jgi:hypothetical protein
LIDHVTDNKAYRLALQQQSTYHPKILEETAKVANNTQDSA